MTDLPRYLMEGYGDMELVPDGDWVKWGDVSARLQQLEELTRVHEETLSRCETLADAEKSNESSEFLRAQLQQLEAEKATLARRLASAEQGIRIVEVEMPNGAVCLAPCAISGCHYDELHEARAALAETRDALHQLVQKLDVILPIVDGYIAMTHIRSGGQYKGPNIIEELKHAKELLARVDAPGSSNAVVPQPRVGDTSTDR